MSLVLINDTRGAALETLENLKVKGVETLIIYPLNGKSNYSDYFISCLFGEIHSTTQDFNVTEDNVNTIFTFIQFYSIRSLNEDSKFDSESYVDSIHKQLFEKFYFLKT